MAIVIVLSPSPIKMILRVTLTRHPHTSPASCHHEDNVLDKLGLHGHSEYNRAY